MGKCIGNQGLVQKMDRSDLSEIFFFFFFFFCNMTRSKLKALDRIHSIFSGAQVPVSPELKSLIWPEFELVQDFMHATVTWKFDEDPIK